VHKASLLEKNSFLLYAQNGLVSNLTNSGQTAGVKINSLFFAFQKNYDFIGNMRQ
jgi:hypothetical protein